MYPITEKVRRELHALENTDTTSDSYADMIAHLLTTPSLPMKKIVFMMKYIDANDCSNIDVLRLNK